jgi:hypothetical protein
MYLDPRRLPSRKMWLREGYRDGRSVFSFDGQMDEERDVRGTYFPSVAVVPLKIV